MRSEPELNTSAIRTAAALSGLPDSRQAAIHTARVCAETLRAASSCHLIFMFFSMHHANEARAISEILRSELSCPLLVGVSTEAVLGEQSELEKQPGLSILALSLPCVALKVFKTDDLPAARIDDEQQLRNLGTEAGFSTDPASPHRGAILLVDPFSVPINAMLPALVRARDLVRSSFPASPPSPIIGGLASGGTRPDSNLFVINDSIRRSGGVGVSFAGNLQLDSLVSQGCKPIGPTMLITRGKGQLITSLAGKPALQVLSEILDSLDDATKQQVRSGLFLGRAVSEYKQRFGRGDFLIRNIIGVDHSTPGSAIAVADLLKIGQTVQFHVRDAKTASEDLAMLLDAQQLHDRPAGALLFTCNGRGSRLFSPPLGPHHDAAMISRAFAASDELVAGPSTAKMGRVISAPSSLMPLAGMFAAGEIGPVGSDGQVFVHGQAACLALFRQPVHVHQHHLPAL